MRRPYAIRLYRDVVSAHMSGLPEGWFTARARYGTEEAAQAQADYHNSFEPRFPAYVIDTREN